jgi:hypothetical protein
VIEDVVDCVGGFVLTVVGWVTGVPGNVVGGATLPGDVVTGDVVTGDVVTGDVVTGDVVVGWFVFMPNWKHGVV